VSVHWEVIGWLHISGYGSSSMFGVFVHCMKWSAKHSI